MEIALDTLTDFGDVAVLFPLAVVLALWLAAMHTWRGTIAWIVALGFCMGGTAIAKIYTFICPTLAELHSPSGHTSLSTLVYGGIAVVLACENGPGRRFFPIATGAAFIAAIAVSRVLVDAHTLIEVAIGLVIGLIATGFFAREYVAHRPAHARLLPLVATIVLLMIVLNGQQVHAEDFLHDIADYFRLNIQSACI